MLVKVASSSYRLLWSIKRYKLTFGKYAVAENFFFIISLIKLILCLPAYWYRNINVLYFAFCLNSLSCYWLNYLLQVRMFVALDAPVRKVRWRKWGFITQLVTFVAMVPIAPLWEGAWHNGSLEKSFEGYDLALTCDREWVYPPRFLAIWVSDFTCALISLAVIACEKAFSNDAERLKMARKMDIENATESMVKLRKEQLTEEGEARRKSGLISSSTYKKMNTQRSDSHPVLKPSASVVKA